MSQYIKENLQYNHGDITAPERLLLAELWAIGAPAFVREGERHITLTAEQNDDRVWAEWRVDKKNYCYLGRTVIDREVDEVVRGRGFCLEWDNAACLSVRKRGDV